MKKGRILSRTSILAIMLIVSGSVFAQRGQRMQNDKGRMGIREGRPAMGMQKAGNRIDAVLDLSDEQKESMESLRVKHQKDMTYQRNLLNEKNAQLKTFMSAPERDQKAVENTIDDISGMKGELMKKQIANRDEMKNILSSEQAEKLESLGNGNVLRQGFRGKNGQGMRDGRRGNSGQDSRRGFHGKGFGRPVN